MYNKSLLILKYIKIAVVIGTIGVLLFIAYIAIIDFDSLHNVGEIVSPFLIILLPVLIFYFNFSEYIKSLIERRKLNFGGTFVKGLLTSIILPVLAAFLGSSSLLGVILTAIIFPVWGLILSTLLTTIFYFVNKHKINSETT